MPARLSSLVGRLHLSAAALSTRLAMVCWWRKSNSPATSPIDCSTGIVWGQTGNRGRAHRQGLDAIDFHRGRSEPQRPRPTDRPQSAGWLIVKISTRPLGIRFSVIGGGDQRFTSSWCWKGPCKSKRIPPRHFYRAAEPYCSSQLGARPVESPGKNHSFGRLFALTFLPVCTSFHPLDNVHAYIVRLSTGEIKSATTPVTRGSVWDYSTI